MGRMFTLFLILYSLIKLTRAGFSGCLGTQEEFLDKIIE